jgi:hypothetical protein
VLEKAWLLLQQGGGWLYWAALTALALGCALLVLGVAWQVRSWSLVRRLPGWRPRRRRRAVAAPTRREGRQLRPLAAAAQPDRRSAGKLKAGLAAYRAEGNSLPADPPAPAVRRQELRVRAPASPATPGGESAPEGHALPALDQLLGRLREVANDLERAAAAGETLAEARADSLLKEAAGEVEYVFKASH